MTIRARKKIDVNMSLSKSYDVIIKPVVTEKATLGNEKGEISFFVDKNASKDEIKYAIEKIFEVKVSKINTLISKGKSKVFKGTKGKRKDTKKAIIKLKDGQSIDIMGNR